MKYFKFLLLVVIFLLIGHEPVNCQSENDIDQFKNIFEPQLHNNHWASQLKNNTNEANFTFSLLFYIYKEIFSSQDIDACVFTPSCSVYAIESIKKKGLITGITSAFDRLMRCNPFGKHSYKMDSQSGKYIDSVE